jgi:hypothetical protein
MNCNWDGGTKLDLQNWHILPFLIVWIKSEDWPCFQSTVFVGKGSFFKIQHVIKLLLLLYLFKIISDKQVVLLFIFPQYELISNAAVSFIVTTTYLWQLYCYKYFVCFRCFPSSPHVFLTHWWPHVMSWLIPLGTGLDL